MTSEAGAIISKRLHISGLTTSLTGSDIAKRLSTFGTVTAVDGFGLLDGLGDTRKFGYITIEATAAKLARCLNLLSGSTWKGAKLRIGDAKPEYPQRLAKERLAALQPPKKKRKFHGGIEAADMSLVTPENVVGRGGWKVTPSGRTVRVMRMRPGRPLPPTLDAQKPKIKTKGKAKREDEKYLDREITTGIKVVAKTDGEVQKRKKKRDRVPDTRARRRTIDPTKYASTHLKGIFLDIAGDGIVVEGPTYDLSENSDASGDEMDVDERLPPKKLVQPQPIVMESSAHSEEVHLHSPVTSDQDQIDTDIASPAFFSSAAIPEDNIDISVEKAYSLDLLKNMFGDSGEWSGRESLDDLDEHHKDARRAPRVELADIAEMDEIVEVPLDGNIRGMQTNSSKEDIHDDASSEAEFEPRHAEAPPEQKEQSLKELFMPCGSASTSGFSLLNPLDLYFEYGAGADEELEAISSAARKEMSREAIPTPSHLKTQPISLNPRDPLFFPHPSSFPTGLMSAEFTTKVKSRDLFDVAKESGWDPRVTFHPLKRQRLDDGSASNEKDGEINDHAKSPDQIEWEVKKEMTKVWQKRAREAGGKVVKRSADGGGSGDRPARKDKRVKSPPVET